MMTVNEVSKLSGVSVRTLHYYDEIGLLRPAAVQPTGYRLYDDDNMQTLQEILLFRELEFPLKEIKRILESPDFDKKRAMDDQIRMLTLKRDRLDRLICHAEDMKRREELKMDFQAFDTSKMEAYKKLAKETWGETDAYKEYEVKAVAQSDKEKRQAAEGLMNVFYEFGNLKSLDPMEEKVQDQVAKLQSFITENYYTCTKEILAGLGQMYAAGGEMTENIDAAGGKGTAEFVAKAIAIHCK